MVPGFVGRPAHADVTYATLEGPPIRAVVSGLWTRAKRPLIESFVRLVQGGERVGS